MVSDSLIRSLLLEQAGPEELSLPAAPVAAPTPGSSMSPNDFTPAPEASVGLAGMPTGAIPTMPTSQGGPMTIQKEVINKELVLSITDELKSVVNTYQKKFESEDMTVDVGSVYLKNFLDALAYSANKIAALITPSEAPEEEMPLEEQPPVEAPAPKVAPETASEPMPEPTVPPEESLFTPGEGEGPEPSKFTNPTEAF